MATLTLDSVITLGVEVPHTATSWQVAIDASFINIVDESLVDEVNLLLWHSMLPKPGGGYYADATELYARAKVHYGPDHASEWFEFATCTQVV